MIDLFHSFRGRRGIRDGTRSNPCKVGSRSAVRRRCCSLFHVPCYIMCQSSAILTLTLNLPKPDCEKGNWSCQKGSWSCEKGDWSCKKGSWSCKKGSDLTIDKGCEGIPFFLVLLNRNVIVTPKSKKTEGDRLVSVFSLQNEQCIRLWMFQSRNFRIKQYWEAFGVFDWLSG